MKILIAEDETMNRRLLEVSTRKWGHEPVLAADGREAWELLQGPDAPSIVLLDWMMPGLDGVEICRRIRDGDQSRMIYVIMVTTNARPDDIVEGLQAGADDYVTKPFDPEELRARVDVGVRVVRLHRELARRESRLAAAQARLADRARFQSAMQGMSDGILTADEQWSITWANRAAELLLNLVDGDYEGRALDEVLGRFDPSVTPEALRESTDETTEVQLAREGEGVTLWIDANITRLFDDEGNLRDVTVTLRDVTDQVDARKREVRFMNSISHKLRTPLTVIGGTLDVIVHLPQERISEAGERLLPICLRQVRRLEETIERLLKFRELSAAEPTPSMREADLREIIPEVEEMVRERYPETAISFEAEVADDARPAPLSPDDARLIVEELVDNAVKFAEEAVRVTVSVDREPEGPVTISVSDDGPGIPHEHLDRVFEGFLQIEEVTTGQVKGLGLGLRIVKEVVEAYGGTVAITSEIGRGTTLTVTVPPD